MDCHLMIGENVGSRRHSITQPTLDIGSILYAIYIYEYVYASFTRNVSGTVDGRKLSLMLLFHESFVVYAARRLANALL
jgi:hypothetical protein